MIEKLNEESALFKDDFDFDEAYEELERLRKDPSKVWAYEMMFKAIKDEEARVKDTAAVARAQGRAEGHAEGRAEGRSEGRMEGYEEAETDLIRKMHLNGMVIEQIAHALSIKMETIVSILNQ